MIDKIVLLEVYAFRDYLCLGHGSSHSCKQTNMTDTRDYLCTCEKNISDKSQISLVKRNLYLYCNTFFRRRYIEFQLYFFFYELRF